MRQDEEALVLDGGQDGVGDFGRLQDVTGGGDGPRRGSSQCVPGVLPSILVFTPIGDGQLTRTPRSP